MQPPIKPVIILVGQLYYDEGKNEYLIISKSTGDAVFYRGAGFYGNLNIDTFIETFQPVDPADVSDAELQFLLNLCPPKTTAKIGFIQD